MYLLFALRLEFMESASFFFHSPFSFYFCVFTVTFRSEHFSKSAYDEFELEFSGSSEPEL